MFDRLITKQPSPLLSLFLVISAFCFGPFASADDNATMQDTINMSVTEHRIKIQGSGVKYKVHAGDLQVVDDTGAPKAAIFHTAYFRTDVDNRAQRPLIFIFNGGPGSSSVWLHLGIYGPKMLVLPSDGEQTGAAPYELKDNPDSLLDIADLVFIDPVGTGFSRALGEYENKAFWGVKGDAEVLASFIRQFLTEHGRWQSPKYLAGESYGSTRAGVLIDQLSIGWGSVEFNGVFLISAITDFMTGDFRDGNELPYMTFLPTYAATAWYHDTVPDKSRWQDLEAFLDDVRQFALNDYAVFLHQGNSASTSLTNQVRDSLIAYTGLSPTYLANTNYRINEFQFMKELKRNEGMTVGRLDSRYLGVAKDPIANRFDADPSGNAIDGAYTAAINQYLVDDLDVKRPARYQILSGQVFGQWDWLYKGSARSQGFLNVTPYFAAAMRKNTDFRLFVANGYYDLATPFFATEYVLARNGIFAERVTMEYYEAGHMMYVHHPSFTKLAQDMRRFLLTQ